MRSGVNALFAGCIAAMLQVTLASAADGPPADERPQQEGENRWVPSLAIIGGLLFQEHTGFSASVIDEAESGGVDPEPETLREPASGDDLAVGPFVGAELSLMSPALPVPTRPRFFIGAEVLPTFASTRSVTVDGDPGCIRGPEVDAVCASEEIADDEITRRPPGFREESANGTGSKTTSEFGTLAFGASLGVSFPFRIQGRQLRVKPSVAWLNYRVEATGLVSEVNCNPVGRCTPTQNSAGTVQPGNFREITMTGSDSQRFNGVGPAVDIEVDTGRFGPIGTSLFLGARFYRVLGDRTIQFGDQQSYGPLETPGLEPLPPAETAARWEVEVDPWLYRAQVGLRLQWLGSGN